ncbi:MAG: helix-turn-helix domain-containing protein [Nitrosomonas sp.]|nr:helix-turn-helix domain-containing protein [Nitrosomonas sp.]
MYNQILLTNILRILEEKGMTKKQLSEKSGVSIAFMQDLTQGRGNPSLKTMEAIAGALETPIQVLLEINDVTDGDLEALLPGNKQKFSDLPAGYKRTYAILNDFQDFQVRQWDAANKKLIQKIKKQ